MVAINYTKHKPYANGNQAFWAHNLADLWQLPGGYGNCKHLMMLANQSSNVDNLYKTHVDTNIWRNSGYSQSQLSVAPKLARNWLLDIEGIA